MPSAQDWPRGREGGWRKEDQIDPLTLSCHAVHLQQAL
jgi:hypothetical protein